MFLFLGAKLTFHVPSAMLVVEKLLLYGVAPSSSVPTSDTTMGTPGCGGTPVAP